MVSLSFDKLRMSGASPLMVMNPLMVSLSFDKLRMSGASPLMVMNPLMVSLSNHERGIAVQGRSSPL
jgi:hypothetical protein